MKTDNNSDMNVLARAGLPTRDDLAGPERRARERRAAEEKTAAKHAEWVAKHTPPPPLTVEQRAEAALLGLERIKKTIRRDVCAKVEKLMAEAREHLEQHTLAKAMYSEQTPPAEILRAAADPIAAKLQKAVGGFDTDDEAVEFVTRTWPLKSARIEATKASDYLSKVGKQANTEQQAFWRCIETAACLATGKASNEATRAAIDAGLL